MKHFMLIFLKCFFSNYWTFVLFVMNIFTIPLIQTCFCSVVFYPLKYRKETEEINTLYTSHIRYNLSSTFMSSLVNHSLALALWCLMALSLIFQLYWWGKAEDPEKTTNLSQVTDKLVNCALQYLKIL